MNDDYRRSSFCGSGNCVEVASLHDGRIALRDSKEIDMPAHTFTRAEWADFLRGARAGEFDFGMQMDRVTPWAATRRSPSRRRR